MQEDTARTAPDDVLLEENMHYLLTIKTDTSEKYQHFSVPKEVYYYVMQLEHYIRRPETSKLLERYPNRFSNAAQVIHKNK